MILTALRVYLLSAAALSLIYMAVFIRMARRNSEDEQERLEADLLADANKHTSPI